MDLGPGQTDLQLVSDVHRRKLQPGQSVRAEKGRQDPHGQKLGEHSNGKEQNQESASLVPRIKHDWASKIATLLLAKHPINRTINRPQKKVSKIQFRVYFHNNRRHRTLNRGQPTRTEKVSLADRRKVQNQISTDFRKADSFYRHIQIKL